jgi:hypothetical protein
VPEVTAEVLCDCLVDGEAGAGTQDVVACTHTQSRREHATRGGAHDYRAHAKSVEVREHAARVTDVCAQQRVRTCAVRVCVCVHGCMCAGVCKWVDL